ncbi:MAG: hypothetical protein ACYC5M_00770 [Anaerolineae bacterium]
MEQMNISAFALPNCPPGQVRFEEMRSIRSLQVTFAGRVPEKIGVSYLRKTWPETRLEELPDMEEPTHFGWIHMDDWFNSTWQQATVRIQRLDDARVLITFDRLTTEFPEMTEYDIDYRRTLGLRLDVEDPTAIQDIAVFTTSEPTTTTLRVQLDANKDTPGNSLRVDGYNAVIKAITPISGVSEEDGRLLLEKPGERAFTLTVDHMTPAWDYSHDDGHVRFTLDDDAFTISLTSLTCQGPVWFAEYGIYITDADDPTTYEQYRRANEGTKSVSALVEEKGEQSYGRAYWGQPRPHPVAYSVACKLARQRFWLDPYGDVVLTKWNLEHVASKDTERFANEGDGRFFFGLQNWTVAARYPDPSPVVSYNLHVNHQALRLEQKSVAVPLARSILEGEPRGDESIICLLRFRFTNWGEEAVQATLPIRYSANSRRSTGFFHTENEDAVDGWLVPKSPLEKLSLRDGRVYGDWQGKSVLRCQVESSMSLGEDETGVALSQELAPGESCEAIVKIPFIALDSDAELQALDGLEFVRAHQEVTRFWREEGKQGAQLEVPVPQLADLYKAHVSYVQMSDLAMPDEPYLVNTSVGTSTYGNFCNESCMIIHDLEQRGLVDDVRRRLQTWVKYQGTVPQPGNFTDYDGMYFGAGGFESGAYNQHHGWVLWRLCEHYLWTGDRDWFGSVVDSAVAGADWVFRQRKNTMQPLLHSRGWEHGFLPAGSLEDVTDFYYWLSTNTLTWRGCDTCARALEAFGHPDAARVRQEADAYGTDLRNGLENMRRHSPLVRLRTGEWVPHYPSRLYCRGRDLGWIREVLEGSVYMLISGLYDSDSREARWILEDYQDNRYMSPPYGYAVSTDPADAWFSRGGLSIQPNLLAGLMPYLERDEPELYIWMFMNAWCSCYREEINAMVEHPYPTLGYSNTAHPKTSDEANAVMWLRNMVLHTQGATLHYGRAIPRAWFADGQTVSLQQAATPFGASSVRYTSQANSGTIRAQVSLPERANPERILVRFRHPEAKPIAAATVNGQAWTKFDAAKGDVDVSGLDGELAIQVSY